MGADTRERPRRRRRWTELRGEEQAAGLMTLLTTVFVVLYAVLANIGHEQSEFCY